MVKEAQFHPGERVSGTPYIVRDLVGSGGMGSVYEVEHAELGKCFVLKALHGHLSSRPDLVGRMRNEWRALARLNHPHIVQVTDAGQTENGLPFFVMEKLNGKTLGQILAERGKLTFQEVGPVMVEVLDALHAAHEAGAIHRDVKPHNIFLQEDGNTKLLDFGIAKLRDQASVVVTAGGVSIGTPRYMAPEQAEGTVVDGRADIYATALVLYESIVGRGPFSHIRDPNELVMAHIGEEPDRADFLDATIPPEVSDLLQRWLSKSPDSRPITAHMAARELCGLLDALPAPIEQEDVASVTLGGRFDASTMGAPSSYPPRVEASSSTPDPSSSTQFGNADTVEPAEDALDPTRTFQESRDWRTRGWGTETGASPDEPHRAGAATPSVRRSARTSDLSVFESTRAKLRADTFSLRSSLKASPAWVVATGVFSFALAWGGVKFVLAGASSAASGEPALEVAPGSSSESPDVDVSSLSRDAEPASPRGAEPRGLEKTRPEPAGDLGSPSNSDSRPGSSGDPSAVEPDQEGAAPASSAHSGIPTSPRPAVESVSAPSRSSPHTPGPRTPGAKPAVVRSSTTQVAERADGSGASTASPAPTKGRSTTTGGTSRSGPPSDELPGSGLW